MSAPVASKIRKPSGPSMATRAKFAVGAAAGAIAGLVTR